MKCACFKNFQKKILSAKMCVEIETYTTFMKCAC